MKKARNRMSATSRTARLSPGTERWLQELTQDLPPDLIDPRELEDLPEDSFRKQAKGVSEPENDLEGAVDTPFSAGDADLLDAATEEQPPTPPAQQKPRRRPRAPARARKRPARTTPVFDEPGGYFARYDDFDDLKSDDMPPQTGEWGRGAPYAEEESARAARRRGVDALYTNLRF